MTLHEIGATGSCAHNERLLYSRVSVYSQRRAENEQVWKGKGLVSGSYVNRDRESGFAAMGRRGVIGGDYYAD
jgi:hypothetical protein